MITRLAMVAVAIAALTLPTGNANASETAAYNNLYIAQIQTGSVNYQAFQAWNDGQIDDDTLLLAYNAHLSMRAAFFEAVDVTSNRRGASWQNVQDHLNDAVVDLWLLQNEDLPSGLQRTAKRALWYGMTAQNAVADIIASQR